MIGDTNRSPARNLLREGLRIWRFVTTATITEPHSPSSSDQMGAPGMPSASLTSSSSLR